MREVRQGLILTDYAGGASLRDLPYLRTAWVNLDDWKRPVRRLLLGKQATVSRPDILSGVLHTVYIHTDRGTYSVHDFADTCA